MSSGFPLGTAALHPDWVEARFNLSGAFAHHTLIAQLVNLVDRGFDCTLPIEAVHGAPALPWNAGRVSKTTFSATELCELLRFLHSWDIGYFPTFTNHLVEEPDLGHPACNQVLEFLAARPDLNGVIITSDLLSDYIARRYPKLRQIASVTKVSLEKGAGRADYYKALTKRFYRYVVDPDDARDLQLMDQLDRDSTEIMVNENCVANCPQRAEHYDVYARSQRATITDDFTVSLGGMSTAGERMFAMMANNRIVSECRAPVHIHRYGEHKRSTNLTRTEVKALYDMGFRHFKLQGRADDAHSYAYDMTRFILEPETVAPLVFKTLSRWLAMPESARMALPPRVEKKPGSPSRALMVTGCGCL